MALTPLIWGSSEWGTDSATWSQPGVYDIAFAVAGSSTVEGAPVTVVPTSFEVSAVSDAEFATTGAVEVDPDNSDVAVSPTTARIYMALPAMYRDDDAAAPASGDSYDAGDSYDEGPTYDSGDPSYDRPLLRYLAAMWDQAGLVEALIDQFASPGSTS